MQPMELQQAIRHFPVDIRQESVLLSMEVASMQSQTAPLNPGVLSLLLEITGPLNQTAIDATLNELVSRHGALRVRFSHTSPLGCSERNRKLATFARTGFFEPGLYCVDICDQARILIERIDLEHLPRGEREAEIVRLTNRCIGVPFAPYSSPQLRVILMRIEATEHLLIMCVNHLVSDAWSMNVLLADFRLLYLHYCGDSVYPSDKGVSSYSDYLTSIWHLRETPRFKTSIAFWRDEWVKFGPFRVSYESFPFTLPSSEPGLLSCGIASLSLNKASAINIIGCARDFKVTLYVFLLAALGILIHQYTRMTAVGLWSQLSNRVVPATVSMMGPLASPHLFGIDMRSNPSGRALVKQVRDSVLNRFGHQDVTTEDLWHALKCRPRFRDVHVLLETSEGDSEGDVYQFPNGGLIRPIHLPLSALRRFSDLGIYVTVTDNKELKLSAHYLESRFPAAAIQWFLEDLIIVALELGANPDKTSLNFQGAATRYPDWSPPDQSHLDEYTVVGSLRIPMAPKN